MKITSPAKINLCLDILKKTSSGYHEIQSILVEVRHLHDTIYLEETQENDKLSIEQGHQKTYNFHLINPKNNLILDAVNLLKSRFSVNKFVQINVIKRIPVASGLGGASSNAAAILKGLNKLWNLNLSPQELAERGKELGMDVPFFIYGGTALATNFGEKITPLPPIKNIEFTIKPSSQWPNLPVSGPSKTKEMYERLDLSKCGQNVNKTQKVLAGIATKNPSLIIENLHNDFETLVQATSGNMSGSGPASFSASISKI